VGATALVRALLQSLPLHIAPAGLSLAVHILLSVTLYLLLLWLLGGIEREDLEWFSTLFQVKKPQTAQECTECG
jgi:hypothetical protein